jgi:hypothetical protein
VKFNQRQPQPPQPQQPGRPMPRPSSAPPTVPAQRGALDRGRAKAEARETNRGNLIAVRYANARSDRQVAEVDYDKLRAAIRRLEDIDQGAANQAWRDLATMLRGLTERIEQSLPKRRRRR